MTKRFLSRRLAIDSLEGQRHFNQFSFVRHAVLSLTRKEARVRGKDDDLRVAKIAIVG